MNQNMTFDPIKDGTLRAASPQTIGVDLTTMQIHQEMWPAECTHFHQNMTFDPIKDGTLGQRCQPLDTKNQTDNPKKSDFPHKNRIFTKSSETIAKYTIFFISVC